MSFSKSVPIITIDGPSGTGKGTLCYRLAHHLGWHALDSGAIYRVLAYAALQKNIAMDNVKDLVQLALHLDLRFAFHEKPHVFFEGTDISSEIRDEACGQNASRVAAIPEVRDALLARQRAFGTLPGLVTDGRDMGTKVFPEANLKIYLDASVEERAKRRYLELKVKGFDVSLAEVIQELEERDLRDSGRVSSPLRPADDAIHVDTTGLTIAQVHENVLKLVRQKFGERLGGISI